MRTIPEVIKREYESGDENRKIMEAYQRVLNPNLNEDATKDALESLKAIIKSSSGDVKKMADGMMASYKKNKGFSKDQANWIYKTSKAIFDSTIYEGKIGKKEYRIKGSTLEYVDDKGQTNIMTLKPQPMAMVEKLLNQLKYSRAGRAMSDSTIYEGSTEDAAKTLDAIIGSTKDSGDDVHKMAVSMKSSYKKNGGFSKKQAQWIYNTSKALFRG